jgi:hypothetical protein
MGKVKKRVTHPPSPFPYEGKGDYQGEIGIKTNSNKGCNYRRMT